MGKVVLFFIALHFKINSLRYIFILMFEYICVSVSGNTLCEKGVLRGKKRMLDSL